METPAQDREIIATKTFHRNLLGVFLLYAFLIPAPLILFGRFQGACLAFLFFAIFAFTNQSFFAPSEQHLDALQRNDEDDPFREDNPYGKIDY